MADHSELRFWFYKTCELEIAAEILRSFLNLPEPGIDAENEWEWAEWGPVESRGPGDWVNLSRLHADFEPLFSEPFLVALRGAPALFVQAHAQELADILQSEVFIGEIWPLSNVNGTQQYKTTIEHLFVPTQPGFD